MVKSAAFVPSIVKLFPTGISSVESNVSVWLERPGLKTITSPEAAVEIASLKLPVPLSLLVVTVRVAEKPVILHNKAAIVIVDLIIVVV
jgi:hypothetical protein